MDKIGKEELVTKLVDLFRTAEEMIIDEAVEQAKKLLAEEKAQKLQKLQLLTTIFEQQDRRLSERGLPNSMLERLATKRGAVFGALMTMEIMEIRSSMPFVVPVIPKGELSLDAQMKLVWHNGEVGYADPYCELILNQVVTPDDFYYLFVVTDSNNFLQGRVVGYGGTLRDLTIEEVIAVCVHTDSDSAAVRGCFHALASDWPQMNGRTRIPEVHMVDPKGRPWLTVYRPGM